MMEADRDFSILVVESSAELNRMLCDALRKTPSFHVASASTLAETRALLDAGPADFVLLDLELSDGTCEELMGYLVATELYERTKVIVLTSGTDRARRDRLFQLGIVDSLSRAHPVNVLANEIKKSISQFIARSGIRILVVDTSAVAAEHVVSVLRNQNYRVATSLRSPEVCDTLKRHPAHLLITALEMPDMDGVALVRRIRREDALLDLPVIVLSDTTDQEQVSRLFRNGANDFLARPFLIENLLLKADVAVSLGKKQRQLSELNAYLKEEISRKVEELRGKDELLELENRHAQMGMMIGALVHQWKQPLQAIHTAAEYIAYVASGPSEREEMVQSILEQVRFLSETMDAFRHFFKPIKKKERFSVRGACENVISLLGETYVGLEISVAGDAGLCVRGYPNEFHQVIVNLLNNAQDVFGARTVESPRVTIAIERAGDDVRTLFCDNGGGIPASVADTLFDRYVSTKGEKGMGIGLHLSRAVIRKIGGTITAHNSGRGACFTITMPLDSETLPDKEA